VKRIIGQERETILHYDGTGEPAVVGSNIPGDVAKLTKLWGPAPDIRGEGNDAWHSWQVAKGTVRLPRPRVKREATEVQKAAGKRLADSRKAKK
jgi:hypothetical protein